MSDQFRYKLDDGREIVLPPFNQIPFGVVRKLRSEDEAGQVFGLIEQIADPATLEVIDSLVMDQIEPLFTAWQKASSVTVGESGASSDS